MRCFKLIEQIAQLKKKIADLEEEAEEYANNEINKMFVD